MGRCPRHVDNQVDWIGGVFTKQIQYLLREFQCGLVGNFIRNEKSAVACEAVFDGDDF